MTKLNSEAVAPGDHPFFMTVFPRRDVTTGEIRTFETWDEFAETIEYLVKSSRGADKASIPSFAPCLFRDNARSKANAGSACAAVIDCDKLSPAQLRSVLDQLVRLDAIVYASPSDDPRSSVRKARIVVRTDRPIAPSESFLLRRGLANDFEVDGDRSCEGDASRQFFVGSVGDTSAREVYRFRGGRALSVEAVTDGERSRGIQDRPEGCGNDPRADYPQATRDLSSDEVSAVVQTFEPLGVDGQKNAVMLALGAFGASRGWSDESIEVVARELLNRWPTVNDVEVGVAAALRGVRYQGPNGGAGFHNLKELALSAEVPGDFGAALETLPNPIGDAKRAEWRETQKRNWALRPEERAEYERLLASGPTNGAQTATDPIGGEPPARSRRRVDESALVELIEEHLPGLIRYDTFGCRVVATRAFERCAAGDWTDLHTTSLKAWFQRTLRLQPSTEAVNGAVELVAHGDTFHPVQDYLSGLTWDGIPRLDSMLADCFAVPSDRYSQRVGRCWMISAVARAMNPGCKADHMLILKGAQGLGKSSGLHALASLDWFSDTAIDFGSKDAMATLPGKWIVEIGELHAFSRSEVTAIKAFVTSRVDIFRPAYGRRDQRYPRSVVFAGTTNSDTFLSDTTGNRRFWVVECASRVNTARIEADRDQLWAEAVHAYRGGEHWWLSAEDECLAADVQARYEDADPWETAIADWLESGARPIPDVQVVAGQGHEGQLVRSKGMLEVTTAFVLEKVLSKPVAQQTNHDAKRVAAILKKFGWRSTRARGADGSRPTVFRPRATQETGR